MIAAMHQLFATSFVVAGLLATLPAQTLEEGYQSSVRGLPVSAGTVGVVAGGALAWFDGTNLVLDDGRSTRVLLAFPSPVFGSFVLQVSPTELLFAENSTGGVWLVPFAGPGAPSLLATINLAYAAAVFDRDQVLVSAKTGGFGSADNDVLALHLRTGQVDPIALLPGASGPVVTDAAHDLYYATASNSYPPPPGGVDVLRFDRSAIQGAFGPSVLTRTDATVVYGGLDAAGSLTLDSDGDLFVVDWLNAQVVEIDDVGGGAPSAGVLIGYAGAGFSAGACQFVPAPLGPAEAQLEPFQPLQAGVLVLHESSYGSVSQLRYVVPARPRTTVSSEPIPPGRFGVVTTGGPIRGHGMLALGTMPGPERAVLPGGFEQPVFWAFGFAAPLVWVQSDFDASGAAWVDLVNPGFGNPLTLGAQVLFIDARGAVIGSAPPVTLTLR